MALDNLFNMKLCHFPLKTHTATVAVCVHARSPHYVGHRSRRQPFNIAVLMGFPEQCLSFTAGFLALSCLWESLCCFIQLREILQEESERNGQEERCGSAQGPEWKQTWCHVRTCGCPTPQCYTQSESVSFLS